MFSNSNTNNNQVTENIIELNEINRISNKI